MDVDEFNSTLDLTLDQQEQRVREHLRQAFRLTRELDHRLNLIPAGMLAGKGSCSSGSDGKITSTQQLRCSLATASAQVLCTFSKATELLLVMNSRATADQCSYQSVIPSAANAPKQACSSDKIRQNCDRGSGMMINPSILAEHQDRGSAMGSIMSPRKVEAAANGCNQAQVEQLGMKQQVTSIHCMGATSTPSGAPRSPPPIGCTQSPSYLPSTTSCELSDNSVLRQHPDSSSPHFSADEATTTAGIIPSRKRYRKVQQQPKNTFRLRGGEDGNAPPQDGHMWRKYGQKEILGAKHKRSYFRCAHKTDMECHAIKHVQQCDDDDVFFNVTYTGCHACQPGTEQQLLRYWPFASPVQYHHHQQMQGAFIHLPNATATILNSAAATAMLIGSNSSSNDNDNNNNNDNTSPSLLHHKNVLPISSSLPISASLSFASSGNHISSSIQAPSYTSTKNSLPNISNGACSSASFTTTPQEQLFLYVPTKTGSQPAVTLQGVGSSTEQQLQFIALALSKDGSSNENHLETSESKEHGQEKRVMCSKEQGLALAPVENWPLFSGAHLAPTSKAASNGLPFTNFGAQVEAVIGDQCDEVKVKQAPSESQKPSSNEHVTARSSEPLGIELTDTCTGHEHLLEDLPNAVLRLDSMDNEDLMAYFGP